MNAHTIAPKPHLDPEQINLERELSLQALERQKENPFHIAFDGWRNLAYGDGPYGHDPMGIKEDLKELSLENLSSIAKRIPLSSPVLAVSGSINNDLEKKIKEMDPFKDLDEKKKEEILSIENEIKSINQTVTPLRFQLLTSNLDNTESSKLKIS